MLHLQQRLVTSSPDPGVVSLHVNAGHFSTTARRVTSPTRGSLPPCKQALSFVSKCNFQKRSRQCGLVSMPARCHMWIEFVVGYLLASRVFQYQYHKLFPNSNSIRLEDPFDNQLMWLPCKYCIIIFIFFIALTYFSL